MRSAMICVSVMLALFLGWPLAFGGRQPVMETSRAEARTPKPAPAQEARLIAAAAVVPAASAKPESCYKRFQRENRGCAGGSAAVCRLKAADNWDLCEATGFWPE